MATPRRARYARVLTLVLLLGSIPWGPARAQTPAVSTLEVRLVGQPVWHEPDDPLGIKLRVSNVGAEEVAGFGIRIGVYERVRSRSALHEAFDLEPGNELYVESPRYPDSALAPGEATTIEVTEPVDSFDNLSTAVDGGVFPVTLTVYDLRTAEPLDFVTTTLIYYPEAPVDPLGIVPVLPLAPAPSQGPDGAFVVPAGEEVASLQQAVAADGWLRGVLAVTTAATKVEPEREAEGRAEDRRRGRGRRKRARDRKKDKPPEPIRPLHVAVAPDPRLLEELAAMAEGFRTTEEEEFRPESPEATAAGETLEALRTMLKQPSVATLLVPYASPDLPLLAELPEDPPTDLLEHLSEGARVGENLLPGELDGAWLLPPDGHLDGTTLDHLKLAGDRAQRIAAISSSSLVPPVDPDLAGCPVAAYTFACPVSLGAGSKGFVSDLGLAERLTPLGAAGISDRLTLQHFFAETSMIREEQPGIAGRVVQVTIPADWTPDPRLSKVLFNGLQLAPWLSSLTPHEALGRSEDPQPAQLTSPPETLPSPEVATFFASEAAAQSVVASYGKVAPDEVERINRLRQNLLVAQRFATYSDLPAATSYVESSVEEAEAELQKIGIIGVGDVTLTSSKGKFQFVLANDTGSPVSVDIELDAEQLDVDQDDLERLSTTYGPGNHPLTISASARVSGSFRATVRVESPDGDGYIIAEKDIQIRSTAFNRIALGITVGALLFLILFYLLRVLRRSRRKDDPEADPA
jgi:hypothetical protein